MGKKTWKSEGILEWRDKLNRISTEE